MRRALGGLIVLGMLLAGCAASSPTACYPLETGAVTALTVEGVRYLADEDVVLTAGDTLGRWRFAGETGEVIGTCGRDLEPGESGGWDVCEVVGDGEHRFLFARPNRFVFGSYVQYFFVREDMPLAPPEAETVSRVVLTVEGREEEINNGDLIAVLLKAYAGGAEQAEPVRGEAAGFTLTLYHRDYPFLAAEIRGRWSGSTGWACFFGADRERYELPAAWAAIVAGEAWGELWESGDV